MPCRTERAIHFASLSSFDFLPGRFNVPTTSEINFYANSSRLLPIVDIPSAVTSQKRPILFGPQKGPGRLKNQSSSAREGRNKSPGSCEEGNQSHSENL